MTEHLPQPERRLSDDELIEREIASCDALETTIGDAAARVIASQLHDGQTSHLYSFVSTGAIHVGVMDELTRTYNELKDDRAARDKIAHLSLYLAQRLGTPLGDRAVEDWSAIWLEQPQDDSDLCPCCSEHIARAHRVGCPLGTDDEEQLDKVLALQAEHGTAVLHWLNYAGFRTIEELNQRAEQFHDYYLGFFPSIEAFRQNYELSPHAYLAQQYEIVEADGGYYIYDR